MIYWLHIRKLKNKGVTVKIPRNNKKSSCILSKTNFPLASIMKPGVYSSWGKRILNYKFSSTKELFFHHNYGTSSFCCQWLSCETQNTIIVHPNYLAAFLGSKFWYFSHHYPYFSSISSLSKKLKKTKRSGRREKYVVKRKACHRSE